MYPHNVKHLGGHKNTKQITRLTYFFNVPFPEVGLIRIWISTQINGWQSNRIKEKSNFKCFLVHLN